jgi:hypothetical protein
MERKVALQNEALDRIAKERAAVEKNLATLKE